MGILGYLKSKSNNLYNRGAKALTTVVSFLVLSTGVVGCGSASKPKSEEKKVDTSENVVKVNGAVRQIRYLTDTLEHRGRTLLYYSNDKITRNYVEKDNLYAMRLYLFSHEDWHAHNDEIKWRFKYRYTPFEYYKLCMHDEISANIAALLTLRYQYMASADKKEFLERYQDSIFGFYFRELKSGKIKPESNNPKDREKEYALIAKGMQEAWMKRSARGYMPTIYGMMQRYVERQGLVKDSRKSYNHVRHHMYNIGGVDFLQYMEHDIVPSDERVFLADGLRNVKSLSKGGLEIMDNVNNGYPLLQNVSIDKQSEAFQHLLIAAKLKYELRKRSAEELEANPQIIDMYYRQIFSKFMNDKTYGQYVSSFPIVNEKSSFARVNSDKEYADIISKIYMFKGVDLSKSVDGFDTECVPIKNEEFKNFSFKHGTYYWIQPMEAKIEFDSKWVKKYRGPVITTDNKEKKKSCKKRISDWQYIAAPNYRQPILTSATKEDNEQIFKAIEKFDSIPQVLKECDTGAQNRYYASLKVVDEKKAFNSKRKQQRNIVRRIRGNTRRER